ncbi:MULTISPECIES: hypothetical protein [unclassified Ensifer]|uniref:hypothetical protein n=1 Tax=unclassified Ensifer TaxID=2633371 RepID=UPI0012E3A9B1|nr:MULTISPECIES: hypothetical protein [unclassified Ensifer]
MKPAAGEAMASRKQVDTLFAYRDLENEICSIDHMSEILSDMLERSLKPAREVDGMPAILITESELSTLSFAWNDVAMRATKLRYAFYAVEQESIQ